MTTNTSFHHKTYKADQYFDNGLTDTSDEEEDKDIIKKVTHVNKTSLKSPIKGGNQNLRTSVEPVLRTFDHGVNEVENGHNNFDSIETFERPAVVYHNEAGYSRETTDDNEDLNKHLTQINHFRPIIQELSSDRIFKNRVKTSYMYSNRPIETTKTRGSESSIPTLSPVFYFDNGFCSESDEERSTSLTFRNVLKTNSVNENYEETPISLTFQNVLSTTKPSGDFFDNGFVSDEEERDNVKMSSHAHQASALKVNSDFTKENTEDDFDSKEYENRSGLNKSRILGETNRDPLTPQNTSPQRLITSDITDSNTISNSTKTVYPMAKTNQTDVINKTSSMSTLGINDAYGAETTNQVTSIEPTSIPVTDKDHKNKSQENEGQQKNVPLIHNLFRNTFSPFGGLRAEARNVFEMQLEDTKEKNQSVGKEQYDDLEIDGEKSHTLKEKVWENLTKYSSPFAENPTKKQNAISQNKEYDKLDGKSGKTPTDLSNKSRSKFSVKRESSYDHTCSGCGRKDCDGNFMKLLRAMIKTGKQKGFEIRNVVPDGNCMFAAVIDQLELVRDCHFSPMALRQSCAQFLKDNPTSEDGTPYYLFIDGESWEDYLSRMGQEGQWGDHLMLQAISNVTRRKITIINGEDENKWTNISPLSAWTPRDEPIYLGHVGELHYVSMRPVHPKDFNEEENISLDLFSLSPSLPYLEENEQQQMFLEDYIDPWSDIPTIHLTFLIKEFIPLKYTIKMADSMCHQAYAIESSTEEFIKSGDSKAVQFKAIGDVVEGLFVASLDGCMSSEDVFSGQWTEVGIICSLTTCIAYPKNMANEGVIDQSDLTVDTDHTHPGYARLLARYPNIWGLDTENTGHMTYYIPNTHRRFDNSDVSKRFKEQYASQNPAIVYLFQKRFSAIYSPFWPDEAKAWISRSRDSGWPSASLVDSIVSEGVYYISQPHVKSTNPDIEFQICFGVAERRLVNEGLTKEQKYCFIVFKAIVSYVLKEDSLINSYHLKNIFFYACEQVPQQYWSSRISGCILYMTDNFMKQLEAGNLPHYFISTNNMIDHFSRDQIQTILVKMKNVRTNPISSLYSIAYENMITNADEIFQDIQQDIDAFHHHSSVRQSVIETLVPAKIKQASKYIEHNSFDVAIEIIQEAHEDRLLVSTCEDNIPFVAFVTEVTNSFGLTKQWWLCVHADETLGTALAPDLSLQHNPIPLKEIVGYDIADRYGELLIPRPLAECLCSLCYDFYVYLSLKHRKRNAVAFLVKARLVFIQLQQFGGMSEDFPCTIDNEDFNLTNIYKIYRCFVQSFVMSSSSEPLSSLRLDEISTEVSAICEQVASQESFTILALMWKCLGNSERHNDALLKLEYASKQSSGQ